MSGWGSLARVLDAYDADFKAEVGTGSAWSGQLRVTLTNPKNGPSRSMTFYSVGAWDAEEVASVVLADFFRWRDESGVEPLPLPEWMKEDDGH